MTSKQTRGSTSSLPRGPLGSFGSSGTALLLLAAATSAAACKESPPELKGGPIVAPSASGVDEEAPVTKGPKANVPAQPEPPPDKFPLTDEQLAKLMNPGNATEYTGPTGVVEGVVTVKGDPPAMKKFMPMPKECDAAIPVHAPAYRAGPKNELADALVAVIGVSGYVRPSREDKVITIRNCSIDPTVIDLSLGQRLMVANADPMPYTPQIPQKSIVRRLAIKDMSPVPLIITQPAAYGMTWLTGAMPGTEVPTATVFVLPNALHTVTKLDGKFRITGVPVGKARVTASHLGMPEAFKDITVEAGKEHKVELTMTYVNPTAPAPSVSASAKKPGEKPLQ